MARVFCLLWLASVSLWARPLLVISIDGLDHRYLRDADKLGLEIPHIRKLIAEGAWAERGVIGVYPTVTFPSHTTLMTGARPDQHGIVNNNTDSGERYFFARYLKATTLWDAAHAAGLKTGAVHWPVTVDSKTVTWDFPEHFKRRKGAAMDWESSAAKATPGLVDRMIAKFPSMPQEWVDDRVRALAAIYLLKYEKPDLVLLHLIDHDGEAHYTGPFSMHAKAVLEYQDELLGQILAARPAAMAVALVSDHGFERVDEVINLYATLNNDGVSGKIRVMGSVVITGDAGAAAYLRKSPLVTEIPLAEWKRFRPDQPVPLAAFQSKPHVQFARSEDAPLRAKAEEPGTHGYWPLRDDYRSTLVLWGPGVKRERLGEVDMLRIAGRLAAILNIAF